MEKSLAPASQQGSCSQSSGGEERSGGEREEGHMLLTAATLRVWRRRRVWGEEGEHHQNKKISESELAIQDA